MKLIRLSIRTLCRFKAYTTINIVGLALSLACVIIISRYVRPVSYTHLDVYKRQAQLHA